MLRGMSCMALQRSGGKQLKFKDAAYAPGLIVVDVSNYDVDSNETGLPSHIRLRSDLRSSTKFGLNL
jgi:hypothetical protein